MTVEVPVYVLDDAIAQLLQAAMFAAALGREASAKRYLQAYDGLRAFTSRENQ